MKQLVRMRASHALTLVPGSKRSQATIARIAVSWTRSAASCGLRVSRCASPSSMRSLARKTVANSVAAVGAALLMPTY